ncbi:MULTISPECIES: endonuclease NucS domain-containing protein [Streptomyces]|uniref:endonuclease NucS domain-containing protein n=1 Tax=Streptomyces TaxID=1883 RepID=UPI001E5BA275|nr:MULTISPECIES: endonuclease NucS domain-containing protein [Streptomyces]UFQ18909.1 endonuclease NucS [Streptomyces huasconensis]WCL88528.1 endonuclease NucS [Streptomyces sp. JCM 35825]
MSGLKLFHTTNSSVTEVTPHLAEVEADVQDLVEAHMETMLGVTFLASEYVIDCVDGGRIDSLGLDENGAPVIVEYKRGTDAGVINQGLYYMAWLTNHKDAFRNLVRDRLGVTAASQILWSAPRLICVAGDFTRYDAHAVREHRRSIDLVRYRYLGSDHFGLETVASVTGHSALAKRVRRRAAGVLARSQGGAMAELARAVDEVLVGLGDGVTRVQRKQYRAYRRLRNFASVCPPQQTKLLVYLKADPKEVDLVPGFTRDVTGLGHHGTGDLELQLRTERDLERAEDLLRLSYAAA